MEKSKRRTFVKYIGISGLASAVFSFIPFKKSVKEISLNKTNKNEKAVVNIHPSAVKRIK